MLKHEEMCAELERQLAAAKQAAQDAAFRHNAQCAEVALQLSVANEAAAAATQTHEVQRAALERQLEELRKQLEVVGAEAAGKAAEQEQQQVCVHLLVQALKGSKAAVH